MAQYKSVRGKRVKMSAGDEQLLMSDRAAAIAAAASRTEHRIELKVGARTLFAKNLENLTAGEITAIKAAGYTVTKL